MLMTSKIRGFVVMPVLMVGLVAGIGGCSSQPKPEAPAPEKAPVTTGAKTITYTANGTMEPQTLTIKTGETVTWINNDAKTHWPASANHPTHNVYPGSGMDKCGTPEQSKIFDACKGIEPGGKFSFTFTEKGSWKFHDHLSVTAPYFGTINVE